MYRTPVSVWLLWFQHKGVLDHFKFIYTIHIKSARKKINSLLFVKYWIALHLPNLFFDTQICWTFDVIKFLFSFAQEQQMVTCWGCVDRVVQIPLTVPANGQSKTIENRRENWGKSSEFSNSFKFLRGWRRSWRPWWRGWAAGTGTTSRRRQKSSSGRRRRTKT